MHIGNQSRERLQAWLSPPNPSINHNIAYKTHHRGSATWFIQGITFEEWKKNGSLLWIRGNRALNSPLSFALHYSYFSAGCGKTVLWYVVQFPTSPTMEIHFFPSSAIIENIRHMAEDRSTILAYYYFDFQDTAKRDLRGLLSSLLMQLTECSVGCWDVLNQLYTTCRDGSEQPSEAALAGCLKDMLVLAGHVPL